MFLIDSSTHVSPEDWELQKQLVKSLAYHFNVSGSGPRASTVKYASDAETVANFTDSNFIEKLENAAPLRQPRRFDNVIYHAARLINITKQRRGPVLVILLTGGRQDRVSVSVHLDNAVKALRMNGARTYVVAIGRRASHSYLVPLVSRDQDIFSINKSTYLPVVAKSLAMNIRTLFGKNFCLTY